MRLFAFGVVANLVADMLNLPVYLRGTTYYLHTRVGKLQVKKSLHTSDKSIAMLRAVELLKAIMKIDLSNIRRYEIDLERGILKADGEDDHRRALEALQAIKSAPRPPSMGESLEMAPTVSATQSGLRLLQLLDKFFLLKSHLTPATVTSYKNTINEFAKFLKNPIITNIGISDVTRYQESISSKNSVRTVDNKIGTIRVLFNFAIKQGYYFEKNPAADRSILTKKQKLKEGWSIFEEPEIQKIYRSEFFSNAKTSDPDYYYVLVLALITGCRINEITSLTRSQFQQNHNGTHFVVIRESKTEAGKREIPLPDIFFSEHFKEFAKRKGEAIFKYVDREGKGSGNAVGKKFSRHLTELNITRPKLVFHSIRKFTNDYFMKNGVGFEPRCQMFGHEIDSVNVATYSKKYSPDELATMANPLQLRLLMMTQVIKTQF